MENLPERIDSKFRYVLLSAARAEQMIRSTAPQPQGKGKKVTRVAMTEIGDGAIDWDYGPAPEPEAQDVASDEESSKSAEQAEG